MKGLKNFEDNRHLFRWCKNCS